MHYQHKGVRFSQDMVENLNEIANKNGISFSDVVRKMVTTSLREKGQHSSQQAKNEGAALLRINVKTMYMLEELITRVGGENASSMLADINKKTEQYLAQHQAQLASEERF